MHCASCAGMIEKTLKKTAGVESAEVNYGTETAKVTYDLEYGTDTLEIHRDAIQPGQSVLLSDDLLATGGTAAATVDLVRQLGGIVTGAAFAVELTFLNGRAKLPGVDVFSLICYDI